MNAAVQPRPAGTEGSTESRPTAAVPTGEPRLAPASIDLSCRWPVLFLVISGALWLAFGLLITVIASIKFHGPGFLGNIEWLTVGRLRPVASNAILYGFASQSAIAISLWLLCRLGGNLLLLPTLIVTGAAFWNFGLTIGILGLFGGASSGFEWLELPMFSWPMLFTAYIFMGASALVNFHARREVILYPSHWFLLAALFWFPWIYSTANLLLLAWPVRGTMQSIVNAWFTHNFLHLWLGCVGIAAITYFIPKLLQRPLASWSLAVFAFWTLVIFAGFGGMAQLVGGPVPAWVASVGIAGNILTLAPLVCLALVWHSTVQNGYGAACNEPVLRFILFGAGSYLTASIIGIVLGLREVSVITHLTYAEVAQKQFAVHGFVAMTFFGALYYMLPRLVERVWPEPRWVRLHFLLYGGGSALIFVALLIGGILQGIRVNNPSLAFLDVSRSTIPFVGMSTLGWILLLAGAVIFLLHLMKLCRPVRARREVRP